MKQKNVLVSLVLFIIAFATLGCSGEGKYKKQVEELNQKLPQGNESIRLDKMAVEDGAFKCYYTILADIPSPTDEELSQAKDMLIQRVKSESEFKVFRDDKLDFYFVYLKPDGTKMWDVKITSEDYL